MENKEYKTIKAPFGYKLQRKLNDGTYVDVSNNEAKIYNDSQLKNYRIIKEEEKSNEPTN